MKIDDMSVEYYATMNECFITFYIVYASAMSFINVSILKTVGVLNSSV